MKTLTYKTTINKPVDLVFNKITDPTLFPNWAKAWGEGMAMSGEWKEGANISFFDTDGRGTKVIVEQIVPNEVIKMKHIAMVENKTDEVEEKDETMKKWIGSREDYYFKSLGDNETELTVVIEADEAFEDMMLAWEQALQYFKEICESN